MLVSLSAKVVRFIGLFVKINWNFFGKNDFFLEIFIFFQKKEKIRIFKIFNIIIFMF